MVRRLGAAGRARRHLGEVAQHALHRLGLAGAALARDAHGLAAPLGDHAAVRDVRHREDVRRHALPLRGDVGAHDGAGVDRERLEGVERDQDVADVGVDAVAVVALAHVVQQRRLVQVVEQHHVLDVLQRHEVHVQARRRLLRRQLQHAPVLSLHGARLALRVPVHHLARNEAIRLVRHPHPLARALETAAHGLQRCAAPEYLAFVSCVCTS